MRYRLSGSVDGNEPAGGVVYRVRCGDAMLLDVDAVTDPTLGSTRSQTECHVIATSLL